ncbi:MAG: protein mobC [Pseudomonadota bacterium]
MKYTPEFVDSVAQKLRDLPAVESVKKTTEMSKQEAIRKLSKDIRAMQKRGYTMDMIADVLKSENIMVSVATLRNYLQSSRGAAPATPRKERRSTAPAE